VTRATPALAAGLATLGLVAALTVGAWWDGTPVVPRGGGLPTGETAWWFAVLLALAFAAYVAGVMLVGRGRVGVGAVLAVALAVQVTPVAAPLLLSTDAWTYWSYGWVAAQGGGNPYTDPPDAFPENPALPWMGAAWRDTTSVYGPAFTLVAEPLAVLAGDSEDAAAWSYKALGALGAVVATLAAARVARRRALAAAFVGWNPLLAVHLAGGGHNDAWVGALLAAALALAAAHRRQGAGAAWALAVLVKWVPAVFLVLRAVQARAAGRAVRHLGFALAAAAVLAAATLAYGLDWLRAVVPLAENGTRETRYALPARVEQLGVPEPAALGLAAVALLLGALWLVREAVRGRARLGLAACLLLATTPYLAVWYLGWAVPVVAADEDRAARVACLALAVYLLPQTIPL
jgi:hypothetical protein